MLGWTTATPIDTVTRGASRVIAKGPIWRRPRHPGEVGTLSPKDATGSKNLLQLVQLRWAAVVGQVVTIGIVEFLLGIRLPLLQMTVVVGTLMALNIASLQRLRMRTCVSNVELFAVLALDVCALTAQLYLSGGITNPFISLYLLQVTLGAVLLDVWWVWGLVGLTSACFIGLSVMHRPLLLPAYLAANPFELYMQGFVLCFFLDALLLVVFVTRISGNLRARDAHLATMRQQAVQEEHIVRMGMLASGAAHELGTPLSTVAVILGDWQRMPELRAIADLPDEIDEMQTAVRRCKSIINGILLSAGEARGDAPNLTTINAFLDGLVRAWNASRSGSSLVFHNNLRQELSIVADRVLEQMLSNLLDNASEAPSFQIRLSASRNGQDLVLAVSDDGPGFTPAMLAQFGNPYQSTKGRLGGGLGLFLVVNVIRKLGGTVTAQNRPEGGATITLNVPLASIAIEKAEADDI